MKVGAASGGVLPGSRDRMIEAAIALMRASGLSGAGINEVVRESGAPKGSVYHYFPQGKLQLTREALAVYSERVNVFIDGALASRRAPPRKVVALFAAFAQRVEAGDFRRSCAGGTVCLDLDEQLDELQPVLAGMFAKWIGTIAAHFDCGDRRRSESFAGLLLTAIEGAYIRSRAERSPRPFEEAGAWLARLVAQGPAA
jgi:AcrR family transcriptional regulator